MGTQTDRANNQGKLWKIAKSHAEFTVHELSAASHLSVDYVRAELRAWAEDGFVKQSGKRGRHVLWKVVEQTGTPATVVNPRTQEDRIWFAMRKGGTFNAMDLAMWSNSTEFPVSAEKAQAYCRILLKAGYLRCETKADGKGRLATYRLVRNTGPRAPVERRIRALWDPNEETFNLQSGSVS